MTDEQQSTALEFDGPRTFHVFGTRYRVLSLDGVVAEGAVLPSAETAAEAHARFWDAASEYTKGATQIAWRRHPELQQLSSGGFTVTARLAAYRPGKQAQ